MAEFVTVAHFRNPITADIARGRLEAEGIPVLLAGGGLGPLSGFFDPATNDIRLHVPEEAAERAVALLQEDWSEEMDDFRE
jgi:hypothetical protein